MILERYRVAGDTAAIMGHSFGGYTTVALSGSVIDTDVSASYCAESQDGWLCDEVAEYLENRYPELENAVLTIHTKQNGEISEAAGAKNQQELKQLRDLAHQIDDNENPFFAK